MHAWIKRQVLQAVQWDTIACMQTASLARHALYCAGEHHAAAHETSANSPTSLMKAFMTLWSIEALTILQAGRVQHKKRQQWQHTAA